MHMYAKFDQHNGLLTDGRTTIVITVQVQRSCNKMIVLSVEHENMYQNLHL